MPFFLLIGVTVGLNVFAQLMLKAGSNQSLLNINLFLGLLAYGLSTVIYIKILGRLNLSVAYPTVIGLTVLGTAISGRFFLGERLNSAQWIGIGAVLFGICLISIKKTF